jgi:branched-chain amino acid transport system substrate-binding protein
LPHCQFYWDTNDDTRAFADRFRKERGGMPPNFFNAGIYSAVTHYLKAVKELGIDKAKASGNVVIEQMKAMPVQDQLFQPGMVRADGKHIHPITVYRVKSPDKLAGDRDYFEPLRTVPGENAFMSLEELGCPLLPTMTLHR